jgi:hypothetical protein
MKNSNQQDVLANILKVIPTKWAIAIVVALFGYVLLQPKLNQWFGWKLPSFTQASNETRQSTTSNKENRPSQSEPASQSERKSSSEPEPLTREKETSTSAIPPEKQNQAERSTDSDRKTTDPKSTEQKPEFLKSIGRNRFQSPAGLVYGPGSEEGHRLKHIERHLEDIPNREGSHGVFDGTMDDFLAAIDDTVTRAKRGDKGTSQREDEGAMIYEASFPKPIGFLGGQSGNRKKNPKLKKMRVVVRDPNVITAFPIP